MKRIEGRTKSSKSSSNSSWMQLHFSESIWFDSV